MTPNLLASTTLLATLALACGDTASDHLPDAPPAPDPAAFSVSVATDKLPILQGTTASLAVTITREPGFTGMITLAPADLPAGVVAAPITVGAGESVATLTLTADPTAAHSLPTDVTIRGTSGSEQATAPVTVTVYGPPGSLDTSFVGGKAMLPAGQADDYAYALAVQPDGKILVGGRSGEHLGDFAVLRLTRDGELDPTFGTGGRVLTDFAGASDTIYALAVQADGKIVAAGSSAQDFALARYTTDGALDTTFGTAGKVTTALGSDADTAYAVLIQSDGKIIVGGDSNRGSSSTGVDFALARYTSSGALDGSFGSGGTVITAFAANGGRDSIYALALQDVGGEPRIVAAGGEGDFTIARYTSAGVLDASFGTGGRVMGPFSSVIGAARAVRVSAGGKLVVAGHAQHDFALVQLMPNGQLDSTFGAGGTVVTAVSATNWDEAHGVAIEADGKIVVAGWVYEGQSSSGNFTVTRYRTDGALDPAFGGTGIVVTPVATGTKADEGRAVMLQDDSRVPTTRVIVAGSVNTTNSDFAVTRYWR